MVAGADLSGRGGRQMRGKFRRLLLAASILVLVASVFAPQPPREVSSQVLLNNVLAHALDIELGRVRRAKYEQPLSSGVMYTALQASGELDRRADVVREPAPPAFSHPGTPENPTVFPAATLGAPNNT